MLLQRELQKAVDVLDCPLDEAMAKARRLTHIIVVLAAGILQDLTFARYLSLAAGSAKLLGVRADDAFCFPDEQFWGDLNSGLLLDADKVNLEAVSVKYRGLFATIATNFTPNASSRVHDAEIKELIHRMRMPSAAPKDPQRDSMINISGPHAPRSSKGGERGKKQNAWSADDAVQVSKTMTEESESLTLPGVVGREDPL
uniref:Uncharacterized protein n=1 Tax=Pyrodinium bahamense TaxID=73915 RepID=A0A7S0FXB9_9DINO|mmetsp:Transcript_7745/g.21502  ORF Transcript_7745/g.21502 Transcript_7745/m.21502 type:complete len:200 (+) Transcript_7745:2-601(+)